MESNHGEILALQDKLQGSKTELLNVHKEKFEEQPWQRNWNRIRLRWKRIKMRRWTWRDKCRKCKLLPPGTGLLDLENSTRCRQLSSDFYTSVKRQRRPHTRTQQSMQNRQNNSRKEEESEKEEDTNAVHQQLPSSEVTCLLQNEHAQCSRASACAGSFLDGGGSFGLFFERERQGRPRLVMKPLRVQPHGGDFGDWNRTKLAPVRNRRLIQFFREKKYIRHWQTPPTISLTTLWRIPVDNHHLELQDHTIPGPQRRICLQPFLPSSTHSQRPFHWNFVTRYVRYVHKHSTFQIQKVPTRTPRKKMPLKKGTFVPGKKKAVYQRQFFIFQISQPLKLPFFTTPRQQSERISNSTPR